MLCGETVAVCCENRTEHTHTVRTSQETHHVSTTEPNRLMLCGETVAVCCENRTEHTDAVRTSQETHVRTVRNTQIQSVPIPHGLQSQSVLFGCGLMASELSLYM
jgi:hypothetical protein